MPEHSSVNPDPLEYPGFGKVRRKFSESQQSWPRLARVPQLVAAAYVGLLIVVIFLAFGIRQHAMRERSLVAALSALNAEVGRLRGQTASNSPPAPSFAAHKDNVPANKPSEHSELAVRALEAQLKASRVELQLLKDELENSRGEETELSARAHEIQGRLEKTGQELEAVIQDRNRALASVQAKQQELEALTLELSTAQDSVERDRRLLAANRDIRDLMGARNLRIIDVFDVDGKGRTRKPFGRVFFTEGKSLVFYAFDLDHDPSSLQAAAFQGWGSHGPYKSAVQSLGIFYRDDQKSNRWFLKFDNPQALAEIDSVFVTIEPPGGSRKPTGVRLLSAYLKADLNHP